MAGGPPLLDLIRAVLRSLPNDNELADRLVDLAAAIAPEIGRDFFRSKLAAGDHGALPELGRLGDTETLIAYIDEHGGSLAAATEPSELKQITDAIGSLKEVLREPVIAALLSRFPSASVPLLPAATSADVDRPELQTAALNSIRQSKSAAELANAVRYLAKVAPSELWPALTAESRIDGLADWLAKADSFDWVTVAQELPRPSDGELPSAAWRLAVSRRLLLTLDEGAHLSENVEAGWMALDENRRVTSHVLAVLARHTDPASAINNLQVIAEGPPPAATLGKLDDIETVFRAYATWLAAVPLRAAAPACLPAAWFGIERLNDANPLVVRAASVLIMAVPEVAARDTCSPSS
jgi:hypothetical protein